MKIGELDIIPATVNDAALVFEFIKALAEYERLPHEVVATEELLKQTLSEFKKRNLAKTRLTRTVISDL